jgi:class 3 adenylate cyclase
VLFCDVVESTILATQPDTGELREVVQAYQRVCAEVIQRFEGYIAQYLGDGLLIYFGYPQAHEDDGQRAVPAALGMVDAMEQLYQYLMQERGVRLAVRLGIHTGLVVGGVSAATYRCEAGKFGNGSDRASSLPVRAGATVASLLVLSLDERYLPTHPHTSATEAEDPGSANGTDGCAACGLYS